jgi:hypothetical protein
MKLYPWPDMQIGETREIVSDKPISSIRSSRSMWAAKPKNRNEDGGRKKFTIAYRTTVGEDGSDKRWHIYDATRTA